MRYIIYLLVYLFGLSNLLDYLYLTPVHEKLNAVLVWTTDKLVSPVCLSSSKNHCTIALLDIEGPSLTFIVDYP